MVQSQIIKPYLRTMRSFDLDSDNNVEIKPHRETCLQETLPTRNTGRRPGSNKLVHNAKTSLAAVTMITKETFREPTPVNHVDINLVVMPVMGIKLTGELSDTSLCPDYNACTISLVW
ncbi:Hypothetical protein CINCED_3A011868 [Cinara cedri]|uniref:Uncharacterized protein n=1 Tax=Cinara cedri TaxID=506608 RepID=A0A5E4M6A1_9HEMI|nr:Hypothetical protein CINCED_3A011868 [Cinara cedri]